MKKRSRKLISFVCVLILCLLAAGALAEECTHNGAPEGSECNICGAWICYHSDETMRGTGFEIVEPYTYESTNPSMHMVYGTLICGTACTNCGELLDGEPVEGVSATSFMWEEHEADENDICTKCGGRVYVCEHANIRTDRYYGGESATVEDIGDPTYHKVSGPMYQDTYCNDCGVMLSEYELVEGEYGERMAKHDASFGDSQCYCGYVFTCPHENAVRTQVESGGYMFFAPKDENVHTFFGNTQWEIYCKDCDLIVGLEEGEITDKNGFDQAHVYQGDSCIRCGFNCIHSDLQEITRETGESVLEQKDNLHHMVKTPVNITYECRDCGKIIVEDTAEENEEEHSFVGNGSAGCVCACGLEGHDIESAQPCFRTGTAVKYESLNLKQHYCYVQLKIGMYCMNCYREFDMQDLDVYVKSRKEQHSFVNGVCNACGAIQKTCDHSNVITDEEYEDSEYIDNTNPGFHTVKETVREVYVCADCGQNMGENPNLITREVQETHYHEVDWTDKCSCKYVFTCSHENVTRSITESGGDMYWALKNETHHQYYGNCSWEYVCEDCGTRIFRDGEGFATDENGVELEHVFERGYCVRCGYKPVEQAVEIVLSAQELYAVAGMEIPLEAELSNGESVSFEYVSDNTNVVEVTEGGALQAVSVGSAVITVGAEGVESAECVVHVLEAIVPPADTTMIEASAFEGSSIEAVDLSACAGVQICDAAFAGCSDLMCVVLPENVVFADSIFDAQCKAMLYCRNEAQVEYAEKNGLDWMMLN